MEDKIYIASTEVTKLWQEKTDLLLELLHQRSTDETLSYEVFKERWDKLETEIDHLYFTMRLLDSKMGGK